MPTVNETITDLLEDISTKVEYPFRPWELRLNDQSNWREELLVVYCVGQGKFSSPPNLSPNLAYINLLMDMYDLNGNWLGTQEGVHLSQSTAADLLAVPPPTPGPFDDPDSPVPQPPAIEWTKGKWTFGDGSSVLAVGPARSRLVPFKDGSFLFMVATGQTITSGTGRYQGCGGTKQATGTAFVPAGLIQAGQFPAPGMTFEAKTIEVFRIVKQRDIGPPPVAPPGPPAAGPQAQAPAAQANAHARRAPARPRK
jgi:hypothetical protein